MKESMMDRFKRLLSQWTNMRVNRGIGISSDDSVVLKSLPSSKQEEDALSSVGIKYKIKNDIGRFEFIGLVRRKDGNVLYRLRHILSAETFDVTKSIFTLLFEKDT